MELKDSEIAKDAYICGDGKSGCEKGFNPDDSECQECEKGCGGWRYPDECPHDGIFDLNSSACKECKQDAMDALNEAYERGSE